MSSAAAVTPEHRQFVHTLAEASGAVIRPYYAAPDLAVESKSDATIVTRADRDAEACMRELITRHFPGHGILGEEYGKENADAEFVWVLDPIDGTLSFAHGSPLFGTLIGLLHQGQPVLGAIHQPVLGQLCVGDGVATTRDGRPVRVRATAALADAVLCTTDLGSVDEYQDLARFDGLRRQVKLFRTWGDCYGYLLLASGFIDAMVDPIVNPWDVLPLIPVVRGAGGVITTWDGGDPVEGASCVAAAPGVHAPVLAALAGG
ncbi:MAG: histidinol-phosphatase [Planctomycetota bacterium]